MATTYRSDISEFLYLGLKEVFIKALQTPRYTYWDKCTHQKTSDKYQEFYETVGNVKPADTTSESASIKYGKIMQGYKTTVTNIKVTNGLQVSLEAMEDDLYNVINTAKTSELVRTMDTARERNVAATWNGVFTNTGADGVFNASASHPLVNSASLNDNLASGAITPDNLVSARNKFNHIYNQSGELFDTTPTHLLTHSDKMYQVMAILESDLRALELSNTKNTLGEIMPGLKPLFNKYLTMNTTTGVAPWHLIDMTLDGAGVIFQKRKGVTTDYYLDKKDTLDFYFNVHERYQSAVISPGYGFVSSLGS